MTGELEKRRMVDIDRLPLRELQGCTAVLWSDIVELWQESKKGAQADKWEPIPEWLRRGTEEKWWLYTLDEFEQLVKTGCFIDYDGHGLWGTKEAQLRDEYVIPSRFDKQKAPEGVTHVIWYNR